VSNAAHISAAAIIILFMIILLSFIH